MRRIAASIVLWLWSCLAFAGWLPLAGVGVPTFFFATAGSDSNLCTQASPCQTVTKANTMAAGSIVKFNGGDSFSTTTGITADVSIASYGTGQATISSGNSAPCISNTNPAGARTISPITCTGGGNTTNTTQGILFQNSGASQIAGPIISGITISGYGQDCILLSAVANFGFNGASITGNTLHDCTGKSGVFTAGVNVNALASPSGTLTSHTNTTISNNTIFNINGFTGAANWVGTGIWVESATTTTVANNLIHDIGLNSTATSGPSCILFDFTDIGVVQFNETYNCLTGNGVDGDGIDLDDAVTNFVVEYNYVHDCTNAGLFGFVFNASLWSNNTYRFNVVANVGEGINLQTTSGAITSAFVYNNTFYSTGTAAASSGTVTATFANNIFYGLGTSGTNTILLVTTPSSQTFTGNAYYGNGNGIAWNGTNYATLAAWQAATGQEKIAGVAVGINAEPRLVTYGYHATTSGYVPASLPQYQAQINSPLLGGGVDITAQYSINIGPTDFYGQAIASSSKIIGAGQQIAWASGTGTCSQATTLLGRLPSTPDTAHQEYYNALLCGFVVDGSLAKLVAFYTLATDVASNALTNLISSSFPLTAVNSPTFTANAGYLGNGTNSHLTSTFNPSTAGSIYTLNSGMWMFYPTLSRTNGSFYGEIGSTDNTNTSGIFMAANTSPAVAFNSPAAGWFPTNHPGDVKALWMVSRTASNLTTMYKNGASFDSQTVASTAMPNQAFWILDVNNGSTTDDPSADQIGYAAWGSGFAAADALLFSYRVNAAATTFGANAF